MIIHNLRKIHSKYRLTDGDVSAHTKSAQTITKEWQKAVCSELIQNEVKVSPENNEKIDIIDFSQNIAYELKVSGKNTHHEFYKDLIKILTCNEYKTNNERINKFIFISEEYGINSLEKRLDSRFIIMLRDTHKLTIQLVKL